LEERLIVSYPTAAGEIVRVAGAQLTLEIEVLPILAAKEDGKGN
jgi:hypothetical protein